MKTKTTGGPSVRETPSSESEVFLSAVEERMSASGRSARSSAGHLSSLRKICRRMEEISESPLSADPALWRELVLECSRKEHALRLLRLSADAMAALPPLPGGANPPLRALAGVEEPLRNDPTSFLSVAEEERLSLLLAGPEGDARRRRDAAMAGLCLRAGAAPSELRALTVSCVERFLSSGVCSFSTDTTWKSLPARRRRSAPLDDRLRPLLLSLLETLPSFGSAPAFSRELLPEAALDRSAIFRAVRSVAEPCLDPGSSPRLAAPQTLANTWRASLFESGLPDDVVAERAGWAAPETLSRFRSSWLASERGRPFVRRG